MGSCASIPMDQILKLGLEVIGEFKGKSLIGKILSVLATPSECDSARPRNYFNVEAYEPYLRCMNGSQHKDVYEVLAFLLAIIIIIFILIMFVVTVVLVRKHVTLKKSSSNSNHFNARLTNINCVDRKSPRESTRDRDVWHQ